MELIFFSPIAHENALAVCLYNKYKCIKILCVNTSRSRVSRVALVGREQSQRGEKKGENN